MLVCGGFYFFLPRYVCRMQLAYLLAYWTYNVDSRSTGSVNNDRHTADHVQNDSCKRLCQGRSIVTRCQMEQQNMIPHGSSTRLSVTKSWVVNFYQIGVPTFASGTN